MKIILNKKDKNAFFSMLSVYDFYAELSEVIKKEVEPHLSALDLIIDKLGNLIVENNFFETNIENNPTFYLQLSKFALGIGKYNLDYYYLSKFHDFPHEVYFKVNIDSLFEKLCQASIDI